MATWRRRDLERRSSERSRRMAGALRPELAIAVIALIVAAVALQQAMAAQSRAELLAHDLSAANAKLRTLDSVAAPPAGLGAPSDPAEAPAPSLAPGAAPR